MVEEIDLNNINKPKQGPVRSNFRKFFVRGLAILLPSVLTIWILLAAYQFVQTRIANPINQGVRILIIETTNWPHVSDAQVQSHKKSVLSSSEKSAAYRDSGQSEKWLIKDTRLSKLNSWWERYHYPLDLIGLIIAIVLIYMVGLVLGSFIGRKIYNRGEEIINRVPLVRRVYPSVKQVTDFFVGEKNQALKFSRVVAFEYPRRGMWSVGLVTGGSVRDIKNVAQEDCVTIFVPSAPTPLTGYVIVLPCSQVVDMDMSVEDVIKFIMSGGVLIPPGQNEEQADGAVQSA